jgi:catechol 2,3-dioxygenase-like lactoylglutathione lyase family enzyme
VRATRVEVVAIDHVQLAMPAGPEAEAGAVAFYGGLLGLARRDKPAPLAARGGCWFERGEVRLHLGVEDDFRPARKAHVALVVDDIDAACRTLDAAGHPTRRTEEVAGSPQWYVDDPFGNRIELLALRPPRGGTDGQSATSR